MRTVVDSRELWIAGVSDCCLWLNVFRLPLTRPQIDAQEKSRRDSGGGIFVLRARLSQSVEL